MASVDVSGGSASGTTGLSSNPHATIYDDWAVSDADGDLSDVTIEVFDSGSLVDSHFHSVGGSSTSESDTFDITHGGGTTYDVTLTVTDAAGNSASQTKTVAAV